MQPLSRRQFISSTGAAVLGAAAGLPRNGQAATGLVASGDLPFLYVHMQASGGWDTTMLCDPKMSPDHANPITHAYSDPSQLTKVGAFTLPDPGKGAMGSRNVLTFFQQYYGSIVAINGVNQETTQHAGGSAANISGSSGDTSPALSALVAASYAGQRAAPLLSGVSDAGCPTEGIIGATPLGTSMRTVLSTPVSGSNIHSPAAWQAVSQAMNARLSRRLAATVLPTRRSRLQLYQAALAGASQLDNLLAAVNDIIAGVPSNGGMGDIGTDLAFDYAVTIASYVQKQTISAEFGFGNFDTHSNSDVNQVAALDPLFAGLDYLLRAAAYAQVDKQILLHVGSDFGRCPFYNNYSLGKDHWPTTTVLLIGTMTRGNRVVGASDAGVQSLPVDPVTLEVSASGTIITPAHIHNNLRSFMGIDNTSLSSRFYLPTTVPLTII